MKKQYVIWINVYSIFIWFRNLKHINTTELKDDIKYLSNVPHLSSVNDLVNLNNGLQNICALVKSRMVRFSKSASYKEASTAESSWEGLWEAICYNRFNSSQISLSRNFYWKF